MIRACVSFHACALGGFGSGLLQTSLPQLFSAKHSHPRPARDPPLIRGGFISQRLSQSWDWILWLDMTSECAMPHMFAVRNLFFAAFDMFYLSMCASMSYFSLVRSCATQSSKDSIYQCRFPLGTWCSGITSASHAEGPGFKSQCVHILTLTNLGDGYPCKQ